MIEFDKAIVIDPMNAEAYLGKAQACEGLGDIEMAIQVLEDGLNSTGDEQLKDKLTEYYLNWAGELIGESDYDKVLKIYDRLLELDHENEIVQLNVGGYLQEYLALLIEQGKYDEAKLLIKKYRDKVSAVDLYEYLAEIEEAEKLETEKIMFKVYDLMMAEDWESLLLLDKSEESAFLLECMTNDRHLFFPDSNASQTESGVGVYKNGSNHYFYCGNYVNSVRSGNGVFYETNNYDGYNFFSGEWKDDAPNEQGKLTKNYYLSDSENFYYMVIEGNYTDGLYDGYINCILTDNENGDFNFSYYATNGTPEDITDEIHKIDILSRAESYIYAYEENGDLVSWSLHLNTSEDKVGVFGFETIYEKRWQDVYIGYINEKRYGGLNYADLDRYSYSLVNIDGDDVPELYIDYGTTAEG